MMKTKEIWNKMNDCNKNDNIYSAMYELMKYCEDKKLYLHYNHQYDIIEVKKHSWSPKYLYRARYSRDIFGGVDLQLTASECLKFLKLMK